MSIKKEMDLNIRGAHPKVKVHEAGGFLITGSQHERVDGTVPAAPPKDFEALRSMSIDQLTELGMRLWDEESRLMLFPGEWYKFIPKGFEIVSISDFSDKEKFNPGVTDDDIRFGCLAYGIVAAK